MLETCVSFDTAKMLYENGFYKEYPFKYVKSVNLLATLPDENNDEQAIKTETLETETYSAPTQQAAEDWIRNVYHQHIAIIPSLDGGYFGVIYDLDYNSDDENFNKKEVYFEDTNGLSFSDCSNCREYCIQYVLRNYRQKYDY